MLYGQTMSELRSQLNQQKQLGVTVEHRDRVSDNVPSHRGLWYKTDDASVVFVDIKGSTKLVNNATLKAVADVYTYFVRGMDIILDEFGSDYTDVQGDGLFGIFSGGNSLFRAIACAITMNTTVQTEMPKYIRKYPISPGKLTVGIGIDQEEVWARRLGLKARGENVVWAGKPVNMASKLSSRASYNQILVSDRVYRSVKGSGKYRESAILEDCPCISSSRNGQKWRSERPATKRGFDFKKIYRTDKVWCEEHADELCEAVVENRNPRITS